MPARIDRGRKEGGSRFVCVCNSYSVGGRRVIDANVKRTYAAIEGVSGLAPVCISFIIGKFVPHSAAMKRRSARGMSCERAEAGVVAVVEGVVLVVGGREGGGGGE